jgi:preprotein translocase subunit SecA
MDISDVSATVNEMRHEVIDVMVARCMPENAYVEQWDTGALHEEVLRVLGVDLPVGDWAREEGIADAEVRERLIDITDRRMAEKAANYGPEILRSVEKSLLLQILDQVWKEHLLTLDHLRQGIGLRAYGQKDPLNEYKRESFGLFEDMLGILRERVTSILCHVELELTPNEEMFLPRPEQEMEESRVDPAFAMAGADVDEPPMPQAATVRVRRAADTIDPTNPTTWGRVARNKACPCGSGKKYKHCHGKVA